MIIPGVSGLGLGETNHDDELELEPGSGQADRG